MNATVSASGAVAQVREETERSRTGQGNVAAAEVREETADRCKPTPRSGVVAEIYRLLAGPGPARQRRQIILLGIGLVAVIVVNMIAQVRLNVWNGTFFDALKSMGLSTFGHQLVVFLKIASVLLVTVVAQTWLQQMMKIRLREWLTHKLLDRWMVPGRIYRLGMTSELGINPDQRIQEDTRLLTELSTELGVGLLQSTLLLLSFIGILWSLSVDMVVPVWGYALVVPGYMVWCAIAYAFVGSFFTWLVGRPLIRLNAERYAREAELRFALVRVSESAESIALYGGETDERRVLNRNVEIVIGAMRRLSGGLSRLTWITSGYGWLGIVVPIIVAAPGYFGGHLTLGGLMMVVGAFNQVQSALRFYVDNFPRLADCRAALGRVVAFHDVLCRFDQVEREWQRIELAPHPEGGLTLEDVSVRRADGMVVVQGASASIRPGERVLIVGESGSGKSTLFRAVAGLWPWGQGRILLPPRESTMFMPQQPYLPLGTLRAAVTYPAGPDAFDDTRVREVLARVGLGELAVFLDKDERWDRMLSLGQQQRLAFARLLLHRPSWVFLDEATAALDEASQRVVMSIFDNELHDATLVSIGHRPGLEVFHTRTLRLVPSADGAQLLPSPAPARPADHDLPTRRPIVLPDLGVEGIPAKAAAAKVAVVNGVVAAGRPVEGDGAAAGGTNGRAVNGHGRTVRPPGKLLRNGHAQAGDDAGPGDGPAINGHAVLHARPAGVNGHAGPNGRRAAIAPGVVARHRPTRWTRHD